MRLVNAQPKHTALFWVTSRPRRGDWRATVILKAGYRLTPNGTAAPDESAPPVASGDDPAEPTSAPRYSSDFVPFKPKADFLVVGAAYAPGGNPVRACRLSIGVGERSKAIAAFGDRRWTAHLDPQPGEPEPFVTLPLGYERAFGGAGDPRNPVGRGLDARPGKPLPNFERPDNFIRHKATRPEPAGFGPLGMTWQPRIGKAGSYDAAWRKNRWPWFPANFDWSFFNAAPPDQQFPFFRGNERLFFENLHPEHAIYRSRLPGVAARIFVERIGEGSSSFEEIAIKLDTVWVDVPAERLVLVWRGVTRVGSPRLHDIGAICATLEPTDAADDIEVHRVAFAALRAKEAPSPEAGAAAAQSERDKLHAAAEAKVAAALSLAAGARQAADAIMKTVGLDLAQRRERLSAQDPMAALENAITAMKSRDPVKAKQLEERLEKLDEKLGLVAGRTMRDPPWSRERIVAALGKSESLAKARLDKLDLAEIDFTGADLKDATLKGAKLGKAQLERANLSGADLTGADLAGADFSGADLGRANLAKASVEGARFAGARLEQTVFAKLDLAGADFSGAVGAGADFTETVLERASFVGASLPRGQFTGTRAAGADFSQAILQAADFSQAQAPGIVMEGADLGNLRASRGADFSAGRFARARAPRSVWQQARLDGADFSRAELTRAQFAEASLQGANFDRARLGETCFDDAKLGEAMLTNANLLRASFERADLKGARCDGSNLYGAGLLDATLDGATFRGSFVVQTLLAR